jgi:ATP-dependent protease ClpP protease subunit
VYLNAKQAVDYGLIDAVLEGAKAGVPTPSQN